MQINDIYQRIILDYAKQVVDSHSIDESNGHFAQLNNPSCGDKLKLQLVVKNGLISNIEYQAAGCIIFKASLSIMTNQLLGKSLNDGQALELAFSKLMTHEAITDEFKTALGDAVALQAIVKLPVRIKCTMLPWKALYQAINGGA